MSTNVHQDTIRITSHHLPEVDLEKVMQRVARENPEWTQDRLSVAETGYRNFWKRCKTTPGGNVPTKDVDEVWHAHILYTRNYADDCQAYFGYFLHHHPHDDAKKCDDDCGTSHECDDIKPQVAKCCNDTSKCSSCKSR